jgi:hypothetical protein
VLDIPGFYLENNSVVADWYSEQSAIWKGALVKYKNVYYVALQDVVDQQ